MTHGRLVPSNHSVAKRVLYDVEWQIRRVRLLAKNNPGLAAGWNTAAGASSNLCALAWYLRGNTDPNVPDDINKVWRVLNLLNAVLLGYGKRQLSVITDMVRRERNRLSDCYRQLQKEGKKLQASSEDTVKKDLAAQPKDVLMMVYSDLRERYDKAMSPHRQELWWFLNLLEKRLRMENV